MTQAIEVTVDFGAIAPELVLAGALLAVLMVDLWLPERRKVFGAAISLAGVIGALIVLSTLIGEQRETFNGMFVIDSFALLFKFFFLAVAAGVILLSITFLDERSRATQGEFYFLLLTSVLGMLLVASARDLLMLFIALETATIPGFIVAGFRREDVRSTEAAVKFFMIGVLSAAVMLFGMSLAYGAAGTTNLAGIASALAGQTGEPLIVGALMLILVGIGFKVSAVPFHFWAPDTYQGAPVPVAAFLSVASKAAGFAALLQIVYAGFPDQAGSWAPLLAVLAIATMTVGNVVALWQSNIVRLMAYSSVAHAGYILLPFGVVAGGDPSLMRDAFAASLSYLIIYAIMNLGAFAVIIAVGRRHGSNQISDYDGLFSREPMLATAMFLFLLSLAGIPPLAGFWAKFFVFMSAINAGAALLAAIMVINSVIGLYYYLSVGARMFLRQAEEPARIGVPVPLAVAIAVAAILVVVVGIAPDLVNHFAPRATLVAG